MRMDDDDGDGQHDTNDDCECRDRQEAELEFVSSAYEPEEAWFEETTDNNKNDGGRCTVVVHRKLKLPSSSSSTESSLYIHLRLTVPSRYPVHVGLDVRVSIENGQKDVMLRKIAMDALPNLLSTCKRTVDENVGDESIFLVFNAAEEWINDVWPNLVHQNSRKENNDVDNQQKLASNRAVNDRNNDDDHDHRILGRRLIYSHHIISKKKRADIKSLASDYDLTGFMKIGWPGLIIIEGLECNCQQFYDTIRPWSWQYLVVRGEQQERASQSNRPRGETKTQTTTNNSRRNIGMDGPKGSYIQHLRRFPTFTETDDMSVVATACREVGLESLFRTSMKQYNNDNEHDNDDDATRDVTSLSHNQSSSMYGVLVLVDHMNDGKSYRKWLRRTSDDIGVFLLAKQFFPNNDYTKRPTIIVGIIGCTTNNTTAIDNTTSNFMKRWRTSRVDVDSKGKACLERQMQVLVEGNLNITYEAILNLCDWDEMSSDHQFTITHRQLDDLLKQIGGESWSNQIQQQQQQQQEQINSQ